MKNITLFISLIFYSITLSAQPSSNPVDKGNKQIGLQIMLAPTDLYWSETILKVNENINTYGLHLAGNYGWFVEKGWFVGVQLNTGFYHSESKNTNAWMQKERIFDIGLAPNTRYYFQVDKKHRFKPFLLAAIPVSYNSYEYIYDQSGSNSNKGSGIELNGTFGFGATYFGQKGNIELNISNMGFFLGVNKHLWNKREQ